MAQHRPDLPLQVGSRPTFLFIEVPAFGRDWAKALEGSRHSYTITPLHDVVRTRQVRLAAAPAVDTRGALVGGLATVERRRPGKARKSAPLPSGSCPSST
ncbi:DUF6247 family protein [Streptomyces sp. NPDC006235]|uniref:DUF6247 family protein n=1 Tax=Streptomyces sp. NPDC006235 TaxID=3156736 RepID=UPI0033BC5FEF